MVEKPLENKTKQAPASESAESSTTLSLATSTGPEIVIFFDGVCNLCNAFVDFVVRQDKTKKFKIASLQGQTAKKNLPHPLTQSLNSVVLWQQGQIYTESTAALKILAALPPPWKWFSGLLFLPTFLRDPAYRLVAHLRYRIFGKKKSCRMPSTEEKSHFLD